MRKINKTHLAQIISYVFIFAGMSWLRATKENLEPPDPIWIVWILASGFMAGSVGWKLREMVCESKD